MYQKFSLKTTPESYFSVLELLRGLLTPDSFSSYAEQVSLKLIVVSEHGVINIIQGNFF